MSMSDGSSNGCTLSGRIQLLHADWLLFSSTFVPFESPAQWLDTHIQDKYPSHPQLLIHMPIFSVKAHTGIPEVCFSDLIGVSQSNKADNGE
jgi:hypothetical protein